jgi:ferric-dicitrate binding protein FerR (iron transport regulator)
VNTQAKISIGFGATLTQLAHLPAGSARSLQDPYAQQRRLWPWVLALVIVAGVAGCAWYFGWIAGLAISPVA